MIPNEVNRFWAREREVMAALERVISPDKVLEDISRVWSVVCTRREGGIVPDRVLWEALKLARLVRVVNESGRMVR